MTPNEWVRRPFDHPWRKVDVRILDEFHWGLAPRHKPAVLYEIRDPRTGKTFISWEEWSLLDDEDERKEGETLEPHFLMHRWIIADKGADESVDVPWEEISRLSGLSVQALTVLATSPNPYERALIYQWTVHLLGPNELDFNPEILSWSDLQERWPEICPHSGSQSGGGTAC